MADIIFPNTYGDDSFESDSMFKGIDWDNFNQKLAQAKDAKEKEVTSDVLDLLESLKESNPGKFHETVKDVMDEDDDKEDKTSGWKTAGDKCAACDCDPCECDEKESSMIKRAPVAFTHPSQLSAEAVEAALASGDKELANAILAARHERRVRLASKIQKTVEAQESQALKLAQRKAYRESLVKTSSKKSKPVTASKNTSAPVTTDKFVKISEMPKAAKVAFAEKALSEGFPAEYVQAVLGESHTSAEKAEEIKNVMASPLDINIKKSAVASMVRTATLTNADYSRLINYWKNELGYGDVEWINALFTKQYD